MMTRSPWWLRRCALLLALGVCSQTACASARDAPELFGEYLRPHRIRVFDGEAWHPTDVVDRLVLRPGSGAQVAFEIDTAAGNGHTCSMTGAAVPVDDLFEYREVLDLPVDEGGEPFECVLRLWVGDGRVVLEDLGHNCRLYYCGMRARLDGLSFERAKPRGR